MIIHTCSTMTVRQYAAYEVDRNPAHLYRCLRPLSSFGLFQDDIQAFVEEFNRLFNPQAENNLLNAIEKLKYQNKLIILNALIEAIHLHLVTRIDLKIQCDKLGVKLPNDENLSKYLVEIEQITGIKIENIDDVKAFRDEVERKGDKFMELFRDKEEQKGSGIMELFFACCQILEQSPDYTSMTLTELSVFKAQAEARAKKMEETYKH